MADAEGLNPSAPKGACGFESRPGHDVFSRVLKTDMDATLLASGDRRSGVSAPTVERRACPCGAGRYLASGDSTAESHPAGHPISPARRRGIASSDSRIRLRSLGAHDDPGETVVRICAVTSAAP